jgi:predicted Zn-dependent protease
MRTSFFKRVSGSGAWALVAMVLVAAGGCAVSEEQEVQMGLQAAPQFEREFGGEYPDPVVQEYFKSVGMRLARHARRPDLPWDFEVLNSKEVNAFALPGGPIYMTAGLLFRLRNEAQLAAILAHEVAHVAERHSAQQIERTQILSGGSSLLGAVIGNDTIGSASQVVAGLAMMQYSRSHEREADKLGLRILAEEGYALEEMVEAMRVIKRASGGGGGTPEFLSTHPDPGNRIEYLSEEIDRRYSMSRRGRTGEEEFGRNVLGRRDRR